MYLLLCAGASAYFVVAPVSEVVYVVCAFPLEVVDVQWMNASSQADSVLATEQNSTAVMSLIVDENEHGQMYTCRGRLERGREQFVYKHYTIIARGI